MFVSSEILASTLVHSVTEALAKLLGLWTEMGISTEKQVERMQTVKAHIEVRSALAALS